ncbi:Protein lin-10 [Aphelenchoides besseyi]|nr:Protein lin-10 [Aphelenchoides besseyi]
MTTTSNGSLPSTSSDSGNSTAPSSHNSNFQNFPGSAPFFANPFMAPFMPQQPVEIDGRSSISPTSSPSPHDLNGVPRNEFRVNPLTGGYFLSPAQYQQMMQDHFMNLMISASTADSSGVQKPKDLTAMTTNPNMSDLLTNGSAFSAPMNQTLRSNALNSSPSTVDQSTSSFETFGNFVGSDVLDAPSLVMTSANVENAEAEGRDSPPLSSNSPPPAKDASSTSELTPRSVTPPSSDTVDDQSNLSKPNEKTETTGTESETEPSTSVSNEVKAEEKVEAKTPQLTSVSETPVASSSTKKAIDDSKRPMNPNAVPPQPAKKPTANPDEKTTELIRKQMNEIEKQIKRQMQNKNIRKMDEAELVQLLNDRGFGNFVDANGTQTDSNDSGLPYRLPQTEAQQPPKPTLEQLRSSFSPPDEKPAIDANGFNFGSTATGNGLGLHGPAAFATNAVMPQGISPMGFQSQPMMNGNYTTTVPAQQSLQQPPLSFGTSNGTISAQPMSVNGTNSSPAFPAYNNGGGGQYFGQMPTFAPSITPEIAAVLLQQLQQQNPALLQNLIGQHHFANAPALNGDHTSTEPSFGNGDNAVKNTSTIVPVAASSIPAPPAPQNLINRRGDANVPSTSKRPSASHSENGWLLTTTSDSLDQQPQNENKENGSQEPVWVMRETFLKRQQREQQRNKQLLEGQNGSLTESDPIPSTAQQPVDETEEEETDKLLKKDPNEAVEEAVRQRKGSNKKETIVHEPAVLIEGVLFRARYLGSTQLTSDGRATKASRMAQAQEAVARVKAPDGDAQPSTEIDLFISTQKIMVLCVELQRISETDVRQDILMDHALKSVSYIADIGELVVLMARRVPQTCGNEEEDAESIRRTPRLICHVFESEEASFIVQSIGQAFQVAYVEFLRANGIDDPTYLREIDYQEVLNSQELMGEELEMFARKETQKDVIVPKKVGEALGVVVVESGWGSMLPTVVVASMAPGGPAARANSLNIGDQIIAINGISLVGLPLTAAQQNIKNAKTSTVVRLTVVSTPPVVEVRIKRPDTKYQLGFSVQNGVICSLLRGGIAERGGIRVGHRIIEINTQSVVAVPHERIVNMLASATGEIQMKTMPTSMFRLLTGQEVPNYI